MTVPSRFGLSVRPQLSIPRSTFDTHFNNAGHLPVAVFKFASLLFTGNPTIDLTNGGVTNLALISVGDITSGSPGGTFTFTGLDALLLASQNGSINLVCRDHIPRYPDAFLLCARNERRSNTGVANRRSRPTYFSMPVETSRSTPELI